MLKSKSISYQLSGIAAGGCSEPIFLVCSRIPYGAVEVKQMLHSLDSEPLCKSKILLHFRSFLCI